MSAARNLADGFAYINVLKQLGGDGSTREGLVGG